MNAIPDHFIQDNFPVGTRFIANNIGHPDTCEFLVIGHHASQKSLFAMSFGFDKTYEVNPATPGMDLVVIHRPVT